MSAPLYLYLAVHPPNGAAAVVCAPGPEWVAPHVWFGTREFDVFTLGLAAPDVPLGRVGYLQMPPADLIRTLRDAEARAGQGCGVIPQASLFGLIQANAELSQEHTGLLMVAYDLVSRCAEIVAEDGDRAPLSMLMDEIHALDDALPKCKAGPGPGGGA